jgi:hypothetical protein
MSQRMVNPPKIRQTKTNHPSPLRKILHRSSETAPEIPVSRPEASRAVTFEPFAMPKQRGLVWGIATPTETPLQSGGQNIKSVEKPLPGLPIQVSRVPVKSVSVQKAHEEHLRLLPRAKSELHLERTMRANSHQSLPELSIIIEEDRPSIRLSKTAPDQTAYVGNKADFSVFDQEAVQADPLAFMPILVPTKAPLRGWSPEDLECPEMTSSNSSLASSRSTSVVTTPLPKWETESAYPFPLVRIANDDDGHAIMDDEVSALNKLPTRSAKLRSGANGKEAGQHHPAIEEMFLELDEAQSQWFNPERKTPTCPKTYNDGRLAAEWISKEINKPRSAAVLPKDAKTKSLVTEKARSTPKPSNQKSSRSSGVRVPVPKLSVTQRVGPATTVATTAIRADRAPDAVREEGSLRKQKQAAAADLFEYADLKDNHRSSHEKGRLEAERTAKEFWSRYKATKSGVLEKPPVKVMLESLFYTAPADLRPCPERLRFLGIRR